MCTHKNETCKNETGEIPGSRHRASGDTLMRGAQRAK
jgi:hypothetical protein